ncbi:hypothetical protein [Klebsiella quasipneumoniae]|uniref:hypothetical protein n=1 Tax=Klebsiella quasipneumoniae TaxID=1463165 RepID=UPI003D35EE8E
MSEFSRETLLNIIETDHVQCGEASALARMALAAIDIKPFAYIIQDKYERERGVEGHLSRSHVSKYVSQDDINEHEITCTPLYRHAQQAPASEPVYQYWCYTTVENSEGDPEEFWFWKDCEKDFYDRWKNAKRTLYKTPQPALVVPDEIKHRIGGLDWGWEGEFNRGWNACRAAMLQASNSPAQSDCCPAQNHVSPAQNSASPAQSPIDHGYRPECECPWCKATARICAELSVNSPANPGCWCRTCRPVVLSDMRFVVCPDCGNKRCPRANDHRNACTGSNEPGQEGSAYPAPPQEVTNGK